MIDEKRVQVAHDAANQEDPSDFVQNWPGRKGALQVGYFGHFYPGRGMGLVWGIANRMNEVDFHLVGGSEEDIDQMKKLFNSNNVHFHGFITPNDVYRYRNNCDVLIAPYQDRVSVHGARGDTSKYMSPLKTFEYMASGKPIVISDLPVLREVLSEKTSILMPSNDVVAWEEALNSLKEAGKRERLGKSAYENFVLKHTWKHRAAAVIKVGEEKVKIMFFAPSMLGGGAERFLTILLKYLDRSRFHPILGLVNSDGPLVTKIPKDIEVINFAKRRVRYSVFQIARKIRSRRPDIVFSNIGHLNVALMLVHPLMPRGTKMIARETNIPSINITQSPFPHLLPILYRIFYPKYNKVICQSKDMALDLLLNLFIPREKLCIINNPVDVEQVCESIQKAESVLPKGKRNIVAAGKLKYQKGFDLLLKSMTQLNRRDFHLTILGKGPEEEHLKAMAQRLGLTQKVTFAGFVENPYPYMAQADVFALTSRFEGFPNVVLEANCCGTPVVAYECPGGINEIIEDGINGFKVELGDTAAFASALNKCVSKTFDKKSLQTYIGRKFGVDKIIDQYENALIQVSAG